MYRFVVTRALAVTLGTLAVGALVGCGPTPVATPGAPTPSAIPSLGTSTPEASAVATPAAPTAVELPGGGELAPGRYTRAAFSPRITFEVGAGWRAVQAEDGFFDIQQDVGSPDVSALQFARPAGFFGADGDLETATTAAAAASTIQANPGLNVLDSSASRMSGLDGFVVEVENPGTAEAPAQVLQVPPGALSIDPGRRLWIALFDTPDGVVAILVGGSAARWEEALLAAEPVLETVTIGR